MKNLLPIIAALLLSACSNQVYTYRQKINVNKEVKLQNPLHSEALSASISETPIIVMPSANNNLLNKYTDNKDEKVKNLSLTTLSFKSPKHLSKTQAGTSLKSSLISHLKKGDHSILKWAHPFGNYSAWNLIITGLILMLIGLLVRLIIPILGYLLSLIGFILLILGLIVYLMSIA